MSGLGTYTFANGNQITGTWKGPSLIIGTGTHTFDDGDTYTGQWQHDRMWGQGVYASSENVRLEGTWKANSYRGNTDTIQTP